MGLMIPKETKYNLHYGAVTDHIATDNHVIDYKRAKLVARENNQRLKDKFKKISGSVSLHMS